MEIIAGKTYLTNDGRLARVIREVDGGFGSQISLYGYVENGFTNTHTCWSKTGENFAMTDDKERLTLCSESPTPVEGESE